MPVLTILKLIVQFLKKHLLPTVLVVLLFLAVYLFRQNKKLNQEVNNKQANIEAYQGIINKSNSSNNVLKLDIEDLQDQNDKLLNEIDSIGKKLKVKSSNVKLVAGITQKVDTVVSAPLPAKVILVKDSCRLDKTLQMNAQTSIRVKLADSLSVSLNLRNLQVLFVENKRQYKRKKNFIKRILTLDFKKVTTTTYEIYNTNDLIKVEDTRVVEMTKDN